MPKWGLTAAQRESKPWGLSSRDLQPAKRITDPIHQDIYLNHIEVRFLDRPPLQRLRRVRQLGATLSYILVRLIPGSLTHSVLCGRRKLTKRGFGQQYGSDPIPDFFQEWATNGETDYERKIAEATILARLGALLHDFCHVPIGHSIPDEFEFQRRTMIMVIVSIRYGSSWIRHLLRH